MTIKIDRMDGSVSAGGAGARQGRPTRVLPPECRIDSCEASNEARADPGRRRVLSALTTLSAASLAGCLATGTAPGSVAPQPYSLKQFVKSDTDHFIEKSQRRIFVSLRRLATKLYRRNPQEWRKSGASGVEAAVDAIFEVNHGWRLAELGYRRDIDALRIALHPIYGGDRVRAFMVGLASMVQTAFGDKVDFYVLNDLDAQRFYNAARNVEIAAWKLASARHVGGRLLLLSNEMGEVNNLSFEREFGRVIGTLEVLTDVIEYKTERTVVRVVQNMASAVFLPLP